MWSLSLPFGMKTQPSLFRNDGCPFLCSDMVRGDYAGGDDGAACFWNGDHLSLIFGKPSLTVSMAQWSFLQHIPELPTDK